MSEKKPDNFYEQSYYQSVHEFEGKFDPEKLIQKYAEIEQDSDRVQRLKKKFSSQHDFLPSITQSVFFGEDEETKKIKARKELNRDMKKKKKMKKKKEYKSDMPEITEFKEMFEGFRLRYDRTTPYEKGTRDYMTNNKKALKKIKKNKGWKNYQKKKFGWKKKAKDSTSKPEFEDLDGESNGQIQTYDTYDDYDQPQYTDENVYEEQENAGMYEDGGYAHEESPLEEYIDNAQHPEQQF